MTAFSRALWLLSALWCTCCVAQDTAAKWIWYPEAPGHECIDQYRYLRRAFELPAAPAAAELWVSVDDHQELYVNGQGPLESLQATGAARRYDLTDLLVGGDNVLAVRVHNATGPAGLIVRLVIDLPERPSVTINSDEQWRAAKEAAEDWTAAGFDDSRWPPAGVIGSALTGPWSEMPVFHTELFITQEEQVALDRWRQTLLAPAEQFADERPARAALRPHNGAPALFIGDDPRPVVMYRGTVDPFSPFGRRQIANFRDAGVHAFVPYVAADALWKGPGEYDFGVADRIIRAYLSVDPEAHLILMVRLVPPAWWMAQHEDELVRYATSDKIDSSDEAGRVRRPSMASEGWLQDASDLWRSLIEHLEAQPWGKRVVGYHAAYGIYAEWHYFGSWTNQYPDTGAAMTRRFRAWLRDKYGTDEALRQAWHRPEAALATAEVPGVAARRDAELVTLRDPSTEQPAIDYYRCQQQVTADAIEHFGKISKQATGGRTIYGVYYGYFYGVHPQNQGGHLQLERLLASPHVDYFVAPYSYSDRLMGDDGRLRSLAATFNHASKTHILEGDIRTYLHPVHEYGRTDNVGQSLAALTREFTTTLTEHTGFWYVDFGPDSRGGWFDDPRLMRRAKELQQVATRAVDIPRQSAARVLLVCDLESGYYLSDGEGMKLAYPMIEAVGAQMHRLGVPFDALFLSQLPAADLSRFDVLVFLNTTAMTDEQAAFVEGLRRTGRHAMAFLWAPGLAGPQGLSEQRASRVTGLELRLDRAWSPGVVRITDEDPLTIALEPREVCSIQVRSAVEIDGFSDPERWTNPRPEADMQEQYTVFETEPIEAGMRWSFDTVSAWTDIHFHDTVPAGDGVGFRVKLDGAPRRVMLQYCIKDANWAEFVAPEEVLVADGEWKQRDYALRSFTHAPWSKLKPEQIALPLQGMKFVIRGVSNVGRCDLQFANLRALEGEVTTRQERGFGSGLVTPLLTPAGSDCRVLGTLEGTDRPGLVLGGEGKGAVLFSAVPFLPVEVLRALLTEAGITAYTADPRDVLRADTRFIAIHTKDGGPRTLHLPRAGQLRDAFTGELVGSGEEVEVGLEPESTSLYELEP